MTVQKHQEVGVPSAQILKDLVNNYTDTQHVPFLPKLQEEMNIIDKAWAEENDGSTMYLSK